MVPEAAPAADRRRSKHGGEGYQRHCYIPPGGGTITEMRAAIGRFVEHDITQNFLIVLLIVNAITLGIATTDLDAGIQHYFDVLDFTCLLIFTVEVALQVIYRGPSRMTTWNWFDLLVIIASWIVEVMVLRAVRVLRIFTLSSRLQFIQDLLDALVEVAPRLAGIVALLLLVLYVYAVLCTSLFPASPYFARLDIAMFTLFQLMTLESWSTIVAETATHEAHWWIFSTFMVITSFILYSLMTACVCNAVAVDSFVDADCQRVLTAVEAKLRELQRRQSWILQQAVRMVAHEADCTIPTSHRRRHHTIIEIRHSSRHASPNHDDDEDDDEDDDNDLSPSSFCRNLWLNVRSGCRKVVSHALTQWVLIVLIILNAFIMGVATLDFVTESDHILAIFDRVDRGFLILFTVEMAVQLVGHDPSKPYDGWLLFDAIVIVISWSLEKVQIARAVRIVRVIRLTARLATLRQLWSALAAVAPSVSYILAGLVLVMYIFAVLCTVLFSDLYEMGVTSQDYFSSLDRTMFTMFQIITMEEWGSIVREAATEYYWAWWVFIPFIILTSFVLKPLVVAVICDAVQSGQNLNEVEVKKKVRRLSTNITGLAVQQRQMLEMLLVASMRLQQHHHQDENDGSSASSWSSWSGHVVLDNNTVAKVHVDHKQNDPHVVESSAIVSSFVRNHFFPK
jgi:Ion transport protein